MYNTSQTSLHENAVTSNFVCAGRSQRCGKVFMAQSSQKKYRNRNLSGYPSTSLKSTEISPNAQTQPASDRPAPTEILGAQCLSGNWARSTKCPLATGPSTVISPTHTACRDLEIFWRDARLLWRPVDTWWICFGVKLDFRERKKRHAVCVGGRLLFPSDYCTQCPLHGRLGAQCSLPPREGGGRLGYTLKFMKIIHL